MNPWGFLVAAVGLVILILGVKGTYGNAISTITGRPYQGTTSTTSSGNAGSNVQLDSKKTGPQSQSQPGVGTRPHP